MPDDVDAALARVLRTIEAIRDPAVRQGVCQRLSDRSQIGALTDIRAAAIAQLADTRGGQAAAGRAIGLAPSTVGTLIQRHRRTVRPKADADETAAAS